MRNSDRKGLVKSASRVMMILELFAEEQRPLAITEIARRLGFPLSSTFGLLHSLVTLGYLNLEVESHTYLPTLRVALLGAWVHDSMFPTGKLLQLMSELNEVTEDTIILSTRRDDHIEVLSALPARTAVRFHVRIGGTRKLTRTTMGHVLLSLESDAYVERLVRRINAEEPNPTRRVAWRTLRPVIQAIREEHYGYSENLVYQGVGMIAMLVPPQPHQDPLVIGLGAPLERLRARRQKIVKTLQDVISRHAAAASPDVSHI
jgi:IclR family transcriptional regulator, KDG regulon repressor